MSEKEIVEKLQEKAVGYFCDRPSNFPIGRPYNCCESVLLALKDHLDVDPKIIPKIGTGIGAGVSLNGLLCGSISSVALAIGIKCGRNSPEDNFEKAHSIDVNEDKWPKLASWYSEDSTNNSYFCDVS